MPKYLFCGSYTQEGLNGFVTEGGSSRREAAIQLTESLGGTLEAYYFAFGEYDFYTIADLPEHVGAIAASLIANSSGAVNVKTVVLISPEDMDEAVAMRGEYRPPGR